LADIPGRWMGSVQITGPERDDVADFCIEAIAEA
jgi:hypothetical protein